MSVGQEFWLVSAGCPNPGVKDNMLKSLQSASVLGSKGMLAQGPWVFNVPDGDQSLNFGSFDNLIRLTDDLQKYDGQVDTIIHRLERQYLELEPKAEFCIKLRQQTQKPLDYLKNWQWEEAKCPKTRTITENAVHIMNVVNRLDEEARGKTALYNDLKSQKGNLAKKEGVNLVGRELVDVLTPEEVTMKGSADDDFIYTDHLTTVVVILPRGTDKEFLGAYERLHENVVPRSAKCFPKLGDKDGNSLWRVVMMRNCVDAFKRACRERRYWARDFEYSEESFTKIKDQRQNLEQQVKRQLDTVKNLYNSAWSEVFVAWMHIKAMRIFVESVLRFGMPPRFGAFVVSVKSTPSTQSAARKALTDILAKGSKAGPTDKKEGDDEEEFFPYVSLSFVPLTAVKA